MGGLNVGSEFYLFIYFLMDGVAAGNCLGAEVGMSLIFLLSGDVWLLSLLAETCWVAWLGKSQLPFCGEP